MTTRIETFFTMDSGKPVFIADKGLKIDLNIKPF
jgi:hypothetical protein